MNIRYRVELHQSERDELKVLLAGGKQPVRRLKRAQILMAADQGASDAEIAERVVCGMSTGLTNQATLSSRAIWRWPSRRHHDPVRHAILPTGRRRRWSRPTARSHRSGLPAEPLSCRVTKWSGLPNTRAARASPCVGAFPENDLKPWRKDMWCIPKVNAAYVAAMEDVLDHFREAARPPTPFWGSNGSRSLTKCTKYCQILGSLCDDPLIKRNANDKPGVRE